MNFRNKFLPLAFFAALSSFSYAQTAPSTMVNDILNGTQSARKEGSGVGGGIVYDSIIAWCDETSIILDESQDEAREAIGFSADYVGALRSYKTGLILAAQAAQDSGNTNLSNSFTLRYIARGIKLAQILGVDTLLSGQVDQTLFGVKRTEALVTFFDWYIGHTKKIGESLDKVFYVPYILRQDCRGPDCQRIPTISTIELEKKMFNSSLSFLKQLEPTFVKLKTDNNSFYTTITPADYLKALSYITREVSKELSDSLFTNAYSCQVRKLSRVSDQLKLYVETRRNGELDAIKLNKYTLELREIIAGLENKKCF